MMEMHRVMTPDAVKSCEGGNVHLTTTKWKDEPIAPQLALDENDAVLRIVQKTVKALSNDDAHRSETESKQDLRKQKSSKIELTCRFVTLDRLCESGIRELTACRKKLWLLLLMMMVMMMMWWYSSDIGQKMQTAA